MKRKEMIQLVVAVIILVAAGALIYSQLVPAKKGAGAKPTIEKITAINPNFDSNAVSHITDSTKVHDYYQAPDFSNLGNSDPFSGSQ